MIFSSVVVGSLDETTLRTVVSDTLSTIGCSLLFSVLLSVFKEMVIGMYPTVVVTGFRVVSGLFAVVNFGRLVVLITVEIDGVDPFVAFVILEAVEDEDEDEDGDEYNEVAVVDVIDEPNEKCGIVF